MAGHNERGGRFAFPKWPSKRGAATQAAVLSATRPAMAQIES
jgi:hypothetical protein